MTHSIQRVRLQYLDEVLHVPYDIFDKLLLPEPNPYSIRNCFYLSSHPCGPPSDCHATALGHLIRGLTKIGLWPKILPTDWKSGVDSLRGNIARLDEIIPASKYQHSDCPHKHRYRELVHPDNSAARNPVLEHHFIHVRRARVLLRRR